jgi:hypothetical protein
MNHGSIFMSGLLLSLISLARYERWQAPPTKKLFRICFYLKEKK